MKRALVPALLLLAAAALAHDGYRNVVIHSGGWTYVDGNLAKGEVASLKSKYDDVAYFELDGNEYVITDRAFIDKLHELVAPQIELGQKQAALGREQAALGREQARLGREQARLGREQARLARERADDSQIESMSARMRELGAAQAELGAKQRELGARQRELGDRQRDLSREIQRDMDRMFDRAVRSGTAKKR